MPQPGAGRHGVGARADAEERAGGHRRPDGVCGRAARTGTAPALRHRRGRAGHTGQDPSVTGAYCTAASAMCCSTTATAEGTSPLSIASTIDVWRSRDIIVGVPADS